VTQAAPREITPARAWVLAARPATLPAAVVPVVVGGAAALAERAHFSPLVFALTLACALLIQIGTNFANDYSDFLKGADSENRLGPMRVTSSGVMTQAQVRRGIVVAFGLAVLIGFYLAWVGGWPIVAIGSLSVISGLAYTGGPFPTGYHGLGDVFVFVFFGVVAVTGTAYLQTGTWSRFAFALSIPVGLLVTNILVVNNLRDLPTDVAAGKRTLATRIGDRATRMQYVAFCLAAFLVPLALAARIGSRWLLLPLVAAPVAVSLIRSVTGGASGRELNPVLERSGQLLLVFGALLAVGAVLTRLG
jgi:1,4-dihydroxy-2-naphthoate polyprenyltransferase